MDKSVCGQVHPAAIISKKAVLGEGVSVGPYALIYDDVQLGAGSFVGPHCILGEPQASFYRDPRYKNPQLEIGVGAVIRSGTIVYSGCTIGDHFETGHRATVRENTRIGHHVCVGTACDIQGFCQIGQYTRLHSSVHVGQHSTIGDFVWIFPYAVFTNDPHPPSENVQGVTIKDFAVIGAQAVLMPGVVVGREAVVGAGSVVYRPVLEGSVVAGNPARRISEARQLLDQQSGEPAYPWPPRFERGMPWQGIGFEAWLRSRQSGSGE